MTEIAKDKGSPKRKGARRSGPDGIVFVKGERVDLESLTPAQREKLKSPKGHEELAGEVTPLPSQPAQRVKGASARAPKTPLIKSRIPGKAKGDPALSELQKQVGEPVPTRPPPQAAAAEPSRAGARAWEYGEGPPSKRRPGQPTRYTPEFCDVLVDHMWKGYSFESFGAVVHVHKDTLYNWLKLFQEFSDAKKMGEVYSQKHWEDLGMDGMTGGPSDFNTGLWIINMKNRFGWRDRVENEHTGPNGGPVKVEHTGDRGGELEKKQATINELKQRLSEVKARPRGSTPQS